MRRAGHRHHTCVLCGLLKETQSEPKARFDMTQDLKQSYRGVLCASCKQAIPVPAIVVNMEAESGTRNIRFAFSTCDAAHAKRNNLTAPPTSSNLTEPLECERAHALARQLRHAALDAPHTHRQASEINHADNSPLSGSGARGSQVATLFLFVALGFCKTFNYR